SLLSERGAQRERKSRVVGVVGQHVGEFHYSALIGFGIPDRQRDPAHPAGGDDLIKAARRAAAVGPDAPDFEVRFALVPHRESVAHHRARPERPEVMLERFHRQARLFCPRPESHPGQHGDPYCQQQERSDGHFQLHCYPLRRRAIESLYRPSLDGGTMPFRRIYTPVAPYTSLSCATMPHSAASFERCPRGVLTSLTASASVSES